MCLLSPITRLRYILAFLLCLLLAACSLSAAPATPSYVPPSMTDKTLVVAWVENGNLVVWTQGEDLPRRVASGGVIRPYLAPDGAHIAFTRGPGGEPQSLWVVDSAGQAEQELVPNDRLRPFQGGRPVIGEVAWLDNEVLYFNTGQVYATGQERQDDLWRANRRTREVVLILPRTDGGQFAISPDRQLIAVVYPGTYGRQDGRIRIVDPLGLRDARDLLFFTGVSTGAEYKFYPDVFWETDSSALRVAIPDPDLVYDDVNSPPADLWRLGVDGTRERLGAASASFFGLPQWAESGFGLVYLRRMDAATSNRFELVVANGDGTEATGYITGEVGELGPPSWLPDSSQFAFVQGEPGTYWLGRQGAPPRRLPDDRSAMFNPVFVGDDSYVYASAQTDSFEVRYARLDSASVTIATVNSPVPVLDVVLVAP
ncbi:MAG: PD40 domain-containing protein [Anaerolineaceae bacterium]|nr:PD40 domain-containing protein [Anaerolineaceae bacterium]